MSDPKEPPWPPAFEHSRARTRDERPTPAEEAAETTRLKKIAFLAAFSGCGRITKAAESVGISRTTHYEWLQNDADYKVAFDAARLQSIDLLEDEAIRRAVEGIDRPLIGRVGKDEDGLVLVATEFSDRLLELLLKGNKPERYRERYEFTGKDGAPLLSDADAGREIAAILEAARAREAAAASSGPAEVGAVSGPADESGGDSGV